MALTAVDRIKKVFFVNLPYIKSTVTEEQGVGVILTFNTLKVTALFINVTITQYYSYNNIKSIN